MLSKPQESRVRAIVAQTVKLSFLTGTARELAILALGEHLAGAGIGSTAGQLLSNAVKDCIRAAGQGEPLRWALESLQALESELIYGKNI